jgi:DNA-directed RNA polymerase specialized sigma24 family protein
VVRFPHLDVDGDCAVADDGSVTHWIRLAQQGDAAAAQPLWERYFHQLVGLARTRLRTLPRRVADEEDVALSAFDSFYRDAQRGRFPQLGDRHDLWRLLVTFTAQKAFDLARHHKAQRRGGGISMAEDAVLDQVVGQAPTPAFAAEVAEETRRLLESLPDENLRAIALWKLEGYTTEEIATKLGCVPRTVERRLAVIRALWTGEPEEGS